MRALLVMLVACGGGATASKKPVEPAPTTTASEPTTAPVQQPAQPACDHKPKRVVFFAIEAIDASSKVEAEQFTEQMTLADPCIDLHPASRTLAEAKRTSHCGAEHPMCMAAIGAEEGADVMLFGRAERARGKVNVVVKAIDIARRQLLAQANRELDAASDLAAVARATLVALLIP